MDGEKIPDERIREIFRKPPGLVFPFTRSCLIVGSRGVGKTTLFRYQKSLHDVDGIALHISLSTVFASLTRETGLGPLTVDVPNELEPLIIGKASSQLAIEITKRLEKRRIKIPFDLLCECLPTNVHYPKEDLIQLERLIAKMSVVEFSGIAETEPLIDFVSEVASICQKNLRPLLLLFDRADMVVAPSIVPILQMLDQSAGFIALVAMRPSPVGQAVANIPSIAGDHYGVVHLGSNPRSEEWLQFAEGAIRAQIGSVIDSIPQPIRRGIHLICRDSLRNSLELVARYLSADSSANDGELRRFEALENAIDELRENQLAAGQRTLQKYHPNFRGLVSQLRAEAIANTACPGPIILSVEKDPPASLFEGVSKVDRFIDEGLRSGCFCLPADAMWTPGLHPSELEIPQLLTWRKGDDLWNGQTPQFTKISRRERDVLGTFAGAKKMPSIFVAYRMNVPESKLFRSDFEEAVQLRRELSDFRVLDGHVPAGTSWASEIRKRIKDAKVLVGDVTGMSSEVMFELGFGYGLRKTTVPVVARPAAVSELPQWLGATQMGHYSDKAGIGGILSDIASHVSDPEFSRPQKAPAPIPSLAVWLRLLEWNENASQQFVQICRKLSIKHEIYDDSNFDETTLRRAASASLLVVSLDGREADSFIHYVCGAVVAHPNVGPGKRLQRRILVIERPNQQSRGFIADSLRRCQPTVRVITLEDVAHQTSVFGTTWNEWSNTTLDTRGMR